MEQNLASHSLLPCKKQRENSALSRQQESAVRTAIAQGVKPASILCHLTMEELQSAAECPAEKRVAGGLEGVLTLPCMITASSDRMPHALLCRRTNPTSIAGIGAEGLEGQGGW